MNIGAQAPYNIGQIKTNTHTGQLIAVSYLKAFPVHDSWARFIVLTLGDPHLLESTQGRQNRSTNPNRVLALGWGHNLDLHCGWRQSCKLLCHALADTSKHGGTT